MLGIFKIDRERSDSKSFQGREYDSLSLRIKGTGFFNTYEKAITARPGDVLYVPKTEAYRQHTVSETVIAIHFLNYTFDKTNRMELLQSENKTLISDLFIKMYNVWKEKNTGYRLQCTSLLYQLLYILHRENKESITSIKDNQDIKEAVLYIHKNFRSEAIQISKLASICSFSEQHFRRLFRKFYDVSPKQYIINLKMEYAVQLLQSHLYSVCQVSERCGFEDEKYFSRLFKRYFGCSPKSYMEFNPDKTNHHRVAL